MLGKHHINIILPFAISYLPYFIAYFLCNDSELIEYTDFKYALDLLVTILAFGFSQMLFKVERKDYVTGALRLQMLVGIFLSVILVFLFPNSVWLFICGMFLTLFQVERNMYLRLTLSNAFYKVYLIQNIALLLGFSLWYFNLLEDISLAYGLILMFSLFYSKWLRKFSMSRIGLYKITHRSFFDLVEGMSSQVIYVSIPFVLNLIIASKEIEVSLHKEFTMYLLFYMSTFFPSNVYGAKIVSLVRRRGDVWLQRKYLFAAVGLAFLLTLISILLFILPSIDFRVILMNMVLLGSLARLVIPINIAKGLIKINIFLSLLELSILLAFFISFSLTGRNILLFMLFSTNVCMLFSFFFINKFKNESKILYS